MNHQIETTETTGTAKTIAHLIVTCPYCGSTNTELSALFGPQLLTVEYYCNGCHTPFEHVKDDDVINVALANERKQKS